jgi:2-polyprenyl-3-methyl-5-hydroxy-6-metoxy-1,4-benzoquinol methylase
VVTSLATLKRSVSTTATAGASASRPAAPVSCPFCGGAGRHAFSARDRNREVSQERFDYARCETCGTVFIADVPSDLGRYYEGDYYHFDSDGEPLWRGNEHRMRSAAYRVGLVRDQVSPGHLIEIGSGTGAFASAAQGAGFDVSAIEMNERCCRYLSEREGITAICSDRPLEALASLPEACAVAMWHVLEHLSNPAEVFEALARKLRPGGVLAIGVPNPRSLQFRLLGSRWAHLDAPRHLCLIPPEALVRRGAELGLRNVTITTNDPEGLEFNLFGWINALRRRPAEGETSRLVGYSAQAVSRAMAPLERTGHRGSTVTLVMRKGS